MLFGAYQYVDIRTTNVRNIVTDVSVRVIHQTCPNQPTTAVLS